MKCIVFALAITCCIFAAFCIAGCSQPADDAAADGQVVFEETISPNEKYGHTGDEAVYYTIRVTQAADNTATVRTESNSGFFEPMSYQLECAAPLTQDDVTTTWTTIMGNTEDTETDQLCIAEIDIRTGDGTVDSRKVNFVSGAFEILSDALP